MTERYLIEQISNDVLLRGRRIRDGAVEKYTIEFAGRPAFLKIERESVGLTGLQRGHACMEKIGAELAIAMGLPTATYEFCQLEDSRRAILSPDFIGQTNGTRNREQTGLALMDSCFGRSQYGYTIANIFAVFDRLKIGFPAVYRPPAEIVTPRQLFVGYLLHDYLIDNPDRHARNWGVQSDELGQGALLPNFDYGEALPDYPLSSEPLRCQVFAERIAESRTCAIKNEGGGLLTMDGMVREIARVEPVALSYWCDQIQGIGSARIAEIVDRIPGGLDNAYRLEFVKMFINCTALRLAKMLRK
jgi:hypothetical protein